MSYPPDVTGPDHMELAQTRAERDAATETLARVASLLPDDELRMAEGDTRALRARIAELEGKLAEAHEALRRAEEYHLEPRRAPDQRDAEFFECDICYEQGGNDLPPIRHSASVVLTTGETGCPFAALATPSPSASAQALTRLVEAALHLSRQRRSGLEHTAVFGDIKMADLEILDYYVDAYLAARVGRGEGE